MIIWRRKRLRVKYTTDFLSFGEGVIGLCSQTAVGEHDADVICWNGSSSYSDCVGSVPPPRRSLWSNSLCGCYIWVSAWVDLWAWEQGCRQWDPHPISSLGMALFTDLCRWLWPFSPATRVNLSNGKGHLCPGHRHREHLCVAQWIPIEFPVGTSDSGLLPRVDSLDIGKKVHARHKS